MFGSCYHLLWLVSSSVDHICPALENPPTSLGCHENVHVSADMLAQEAPQPFTSQGATSSSTSHVKLGGSAPSSFWNTLCILLLKHLYLYPEHHKTPFSVAPTTSTSDPSLYINVQVRYMGQVEDRYQFIVLHTHDFSLASVSLRFHLSLHPTSSHWSFQPQTLSNPI